MLRVSVLAGASDRVSAPSYLDLVVTLAEASDDHRLQHHNIYPLSNVDRWHCPSTLRNGDHDDPCCFGSFRWR